MADTAAAATRIADPALGIPKDVLGEQPGTAAQTDVGTPTGMSTMDQQAMERALADQASIPNQGTTTSAGLVTDTGTGLGSKIIQAAEHYLDVPYVWGGTGPGGVDCSGLVQLAYKAAGITLPRISYQQANSGQRVAINKLRPGDLVAWDNSTRNNGADHIAIYLGDGRIIEAPRPGARVHITSLYDLGEAYGVRMGWQ